MGSARIASAVENMARDFWLFNHVEQPSIRIYGWSRPAVSLGYRQRHDPPEQLETWLDSYDVVVRPTGGGYLFHDRDLSYSVVLPETHPLTELSIMELYGRIRDRIEQSLLEHGWLSKSDRGGNSDSSESCLAEPGDHEPVTGGNKWMGAAQSRRNGRVIQQGSLFWESRDNQFGKTHGLSQSGQGRAELVDLLAQALQTVIRKDERHSITFNPNLDSGWETLEKQVTKVAVST